MSGSIRGRFLMLLLVVAVTAAALLPAAPVQAGECWQDYTQTCYYIGGNTCFAGCNQYYCTLNPNPSPEDLLECENRWEWCC